MDNTAPSSAPAGHVIHIGPDALTSARIQANLIAGDVRSGQAEPPRAHVKYKDPAPGAADEWQTPAQVNKSGVATCNSLPRAYAPHVDASHVGVVQLPDKDGKLVNHGFLVADAKPGDKPLAVGGDGKAVGGIPADRIVDPSVAHGMNGGKPLPSSLYQNAALAPIYPPGDHDLSHVHAPDADRAAEGHAYAGAERLHTPTTEAGATVAAVSHLAGRRITPPVEHVARPLEELYPGHPVLSAIGSAEDRLKVAAPWLTTKKMVHQYVDGLEAVAAGQNPAPLSTDPPITAEHRAAADRLRDHVVTLAGNVLGKPESVAKLDEHAAALAANDRSEPEHDAHATMIAEVDAMLPLVTPHHVREGLCRSPPDYEVGMIDGEREGWGGDLALSLALGEALGSFSCGHPHDERRPPRPARVIDPRMGAAPASVASAPPASAPSAPPGGGSGGHPNLPAAGPLPSLPPPAVAGDGVGHEEGGGHHGHDHGDWPPRFGHHHGRRWGSIGGVDVVGGGVNLLDEGDDGGEVVETTEVIDYETAPSAPRVMRVPGPTQIVRVPVPVRQPEPVVAAGPQVVEVERREEWPPRFGRRPAQGGGWWSRLGFGGRGRETEREHRLHEREREAADRGRMGHGHHETAHQRDVRARERQAELRASGHGLQAEVQHDLDRERDHRARVEAAKHDPRMGAVWHGRHGDRLLGGRGFQRAIWAWQTDPFTRARLEAGGTAYGYALPELQALVDPPMLGLGAAGGGDDGRDPPLAGSVFTTPARRSPLYGGRNYRSGGAWPPVIVRRRAPQVVVVDDDDAGDDPPLFGYSAPRCATGCGTGL